MNPAGDAEKLASVFNAEAIQYLFIGQSGSIIMGYPGTTQDVDIFAKFTVDNAERMVAALATLGFRVDPKLASEIRAGKDFIQIRGNGPFDLDIIFAPVGIDSFEKAAENAVIIAGLPVMHPADIVRSKLAANRQKDRETLPRLRVFSEWIQQKWQREGFPESYREPMPDLMEPDERS